MAESRTMATRMDQLLDKWSWFVAGAISVTYLGFGLATGKGMEASPAGAAQVALLIGYLLFVVVVPLAAVAGIVAPIWCIVRRGAPVAPRIGRVLVSAAAAGAWYWSLTSRFLELP